MQRAQDGGAISNTGGFGWAIKTSIFDSNFAVETAQIILSDSKFTLFNSTFIAGNRTLKEAVLISSGTKTIDFGECAPGSTPGEAGLSIRADRDFTGCPLLCPRGTLGPGGESSLLRNLTSGCALGCNTCPAGGTCAAAGLAALTLCGPGHHNPDTGSQTDSSCRPCESGSYQIEAGATACIPCPAGSYIAAKGSTACSPCSAGGYCEDVGASSASVFQLCQPGTWSDIIGLNNSKGCRPCGQIILTLTLTLTLILTLILPLTLTLTLALTLTLGVGTYQPITGASSSGSCLPCPIGTASNAVGVGACELCAPGTYQPGKQASSCLPCEDDNLGVYCPNEGTSTPTPCPGGTHSNATGLSSDLQCTPVQAGEYAPTGSKFPEACPASGFTCPGRAVDEVNSPPGSKPILVVSGQASIDVETDTVTFDLEVDMSPEDYDEAALIAELAALYGVSADLISLEATPISARRKLTSNVTAAASSAAQRLRLSVTILVPTDFVDESAGVLDTESSLTEAGGASSSSGAVGPGVSAAGRLANRLAAVNSAGGAGLSAMLGFNVTLTQNVLVGTVSRQVSASCAPGYWCSAANSIPCVPNTFQPKINQIDAGACKACPDFSQSPSSSASLQDCKCRAETATAAGYYDSEPAASKVSCKICTAGSSCPTIGTTTATLNISVGWYRTSSSSTDLRRCPDSSRKGSGCTGGVGDEGPCKPYAASRLEQGLACPN